MLSMGPKLHVLGFSEFTGFKVSIPLPYVLVYYLIPLLRYTRVPSRLYVLVNVSLSLLSSLGMKSLSERCSSRDLLERYL